MTRLQRYRLLVLALFLAGLTGLGVCGYLFLRDQIPDMIRIEQGQEVPAILHFPYSTIIEEAVEAGSRGTSDIPQEKLHMTSEDPASGEGPARIAADFSDCSAKIQCSLLGLIPLKTVEVEAGSRQVVSAGGMPVGIYIETQGILVIGTGEVEGADGKPHEPAEHIVETGDYILSANGKKLESKEDLVACINASEGKKMELEVLREDQEMELAVTPVQTGSGEYKAGIWVRNDAQGVGTLTYTDEEGNFGALGHGISDVDTSTLLSLKDGKLYEADVVSVTKGQRGEPGELAGVIHYRDSSVLGSIEKNTSSGIFGRVEDSRLSQETEEYEVAYKQEVEPGEASILCSVDGGVEEYAIAIESLDMNKKEVNKGMTIRVTDERLLEKTGGIVQGMSGSPILQNGRIVGAVTHVFVNDPAKGYGIFIENMLEQ